MGTRSLSTRTTALSEYLFVSTTTTRLSPSKPHSLTSLPSSPPRRYIQIQQGYPLSDRILFLQTRSSYFSGFALPLTLLTSLPFLPPLASTTIFALMFPGYLILAASARPVPSAGAFGGLSGGGGGGGEHGGEEEGEGAGHEGEWWEWWPKRVRVLEGGLWAVGMWEAVTEGMSLGGGGAGARGHRRKGSRL